MKRAFTLVELIVIVVISSILALGTYVFMQQMLKRAIVADFITQKSLQTQAAIDQLAYMLKARVVNSTISYHRTDNRDELLDAEGDEGRILEWIGEEVDLKYRGVYSGFIDLDASTQNNIIAKDFNLTDFNVTGYAVIFSGYNDLGEGNYTQYGWHGRGNEKVYSITAANDMGSNDANLTLNGTPNTHYEKFYLVKSGYAVARGEELDKGDFACDNNNILDYIADNNFDNTLFLFYDFQPWNGETFCADSGGGNRAGKATVLLDEVSAFEAKYDGVSMVVQIQAEMDNDNKSDNNITITKTKAVF
jgi:type II secretory pathway pseudopilin PulG